MNLRSSRFQYILGIPVLYAVIAGLLIVYLNPIIAKSGIEPALRAQMLTAVPWFFTLLTTLLLLGILYREFNQHIKIESSLRLANDTLETFVRASPLAVIILDHQGNTLVWNPASERIFGWQASEVLGSQPPFIQPESMPGFGAARRSLFSGKTVSVVEVVAVRKDNSRITLDIYAVPLHNPAGEVERIILLIADTSDRIAAAQHLQKQLDRLGALRRIDMAISASLDLNFTLDIFIDQIQALLGVDAVAVVLLNPHNQSLEYRRLRGMRSERLPQIINYGNENAGRVARERQTLMIPDLPRQFLENPRELSPLETIIQNEGFIGYVGVPLLAKGQVLGVVEVYTRKPKDFDAEWLEFLHTLAKQAAIAVDNAVLFEQLTRTNAELIGSYDATLEGWALALEMRDRETHGHTMRLTKMAVDLARAMGLNDAEIANIHRGALLHDIGKLGVPDHILLKEGSLTEEEWAIMREHPAHAYRLLSRIAYLRPALDIPYCHHEHWDGSGYPRGLKGEQIPLPARIFAVADIYDALINDRPYRKALPEDQVLAYIREQSGRHLDPVVVKVFDRMHLLGRL